MSFDPNHIQIVDSDFHRNGVSGMPFKVAIIDDANTSDMKLVVMFEAEGHTAVLSLTKLLEEDDISFGSNSWRGDQYEEALRPELWPNSEEDEDLL
jgi:hypothetical protein